MDPRWPAEPYVYAYYTRIGERARLVRYRASGDVSDPDGESLALQSPVLLIDDIRDTFFSHNGGSLRFGPDQHLYLSLGDDLTLCNTQDSTSLRGQILRLGPSPFRDQIQITLRSSSGAVSLEVLDASGDGARRERLRILRLR